ncbi:MAG: dihydrodipicolinate synthase family protein [Bryobacteraceae bacterium]|nr:dihydrodipicolinate synthase family protein [Bryobacteraceae bacterium]
MTPFQGIVPILNTTFHDDGTLDLGSQSRLTSHLLAQGASGLGLFGNASEGYALLEEERRSILEVVRKEVNGRVPLIVSSGANGTDAAVLLSQQAEEQGASCLMVLPPFYMKTDADGLMHYFEAISQSVKIPIMVQDAPLMTQVVMPPALLARMAREIENVRYAKVEAPPTAPKITATRKAAGEDLILFGGLNGQFLIEEFDRGALGMMPGSDMIEIFCAIWKHLTAGNRNAAWQAFTRALPLIRFELQPGMGVSAMKHNLVSAGIIHSARVRHPTASLDNVSLNELAFLRAWVYSDVAQAALI